MRKVHLLLIGMLAMASASIAAVPQGHSTATVAPAAVVSTANAATAPAAAPMTLADVFAPATPAAHACNLLCIQGYHCCVQGNQATCIPNSQACP